MMYMLRFLRCAAQGGAGLPRFAMEATPERRTARRVAARPVARLHGPIPLRGSLGQRSGGPSLADRRSSQIVNRFSIRARCAISASRTASYSEARLRSCPTITSGALDTKASLLSLTRHLESSASMRRISLSSRARSATGSVSAFSRAVPHIRKTRERAHIGRECSQQSLVAARKKRCASARRQLYLASERPACLNGGFKLRDPSLGVRIDFFRLRARIGLHHNRI